MEPGGPVQHQRIGYPHLLRHWQYATRSLHAVFAVSWYPKPANGLSPQAHAISHIQRREHVR